MITASVMKELNKFYETTFNINPLMHSVPKCSGTLAAFARRYRYNPFSRIIYAISAFFKKHNLRPCSSTQSTNFFRFFAVLSPTADCWKFLDRQNVFFDDRLILFSYSICKNKSKYVFHSQK